LLAAFGVRYFANLAALLMNDNRPLFSSDKEELVDGKKFAKPELRRRRRHQADATIHHHLKFIIYNS